MAPLKYRRMPLLCDFDVSRRLIGLVADIEIAPPSRAALANPSPSHYRGERLGNVLGNISIQIEALPELGAEMQLIKRARRVPNSNRRNLGEEFR